MSATGTGAWAAGGATTSVAWSGSGAAGAEGATATAASRRSTVPEKPTVASLSWCWLMRGIAPLRPKGGVFWFRAPESPALPPVSSAMQGSQPVAHPYWRD